MTVIELSEKDVDALARTAMSEVGHFGKYGPEILKGGVEAVVDTILNRVAHPAYPDTVSEVVNARAQFSAIGGPGGVKSWSKLRKASNEVETIVREHLAARLDGQPCTVKGAGHFLNPFVSSKSALRDWGNHVVKHAVAQWGHKQDIHFHGYAPQSGPPLAYTLQMDGRSHSFTGRGESAAVSGGPGGTQAASVAEMTTAEATPDEDPGLPGGGAEDGETLAYTVEEVDGADAGALQALLNQHSAEGWRLRQILPSREKLLVVFESSQAEDLIHEADDRGEDEEEEEDQPVPLATPRVVTDASPEGRFARFMADLNLQHFAPAEFLFLGGQNGVSGPSKGKNRLPPEEIWGNIKPTAVLLERLRAELGAAVRLSSIYRDPAYNALLPGAATGSQHTQFRAADFSCADGRNSVWWGKQAKRLRDEGVFQGGIGIYPTFVHVDTRDKNAQWGPWRDRVFG